VRVVLGSLLTFAALVAVIMRHTFDGTGLILLCSCLRFRVWATEDYEFDKIRNAGVTGNATDHKISQGDNPVCSTRDEISQPSQLFSPRAATV